MRTHLHPAVLLALLMGLSTSGSAWADSCRHSREIQRALPADAVQRMVVEARAGELRVTGVEGLEAVRVSAEACASHQEILEEIGMELRSERGVAVLQARIPDTDGWSWRDRYALLHLSVEIPRGMAAEIDDTSGPLEVEGTGDTRIRDSSGSIRARGISGSLDVDDSSGSIDIMDVTGPVMVDDSSGSIEIDQVLGDVTIARDSSGSIRIRDVEGSVHVLRDSSGSIEVVGISGDFSVDRDGSGSIRYRDVAGEVRIPDDDDWY